MIMYPNIAFYENKSYTNLSDKAYDILEEAMVTLELTPGQIYTERYLSELTGIGRSPVREAIRRLEPTHIIESIPRSGIKISPISLEECYLQLEVRTMLEKLAILRACKMATPEERAQLRELQTRYETANNASNALDATRVDNEFNYFVADCARNTFVKTALMPLHTLARRLYYMQYHVDEALTARINLAHCKLMASIADGNGEQAMGNMDELIQTVKELSLSIISPSSYGIGLPTF